MARKRTTKDQIESHRAVNKKSREKYIERYRASSRERYRSRRDSPEFKESRRLYSIKYRSDPVSRAKIRACKLAWRRKNKAKVREQNHRARNKNNNGFAPAILLESEISILEKQGWACKICGAGLRRRKDTHLDHCHLTGKVRGILCNMCNIGIGMMEDNSFLLASATNYILNHGEVSPPSTPLRARKTESNDDNAAATSEPMIWELA